MQCISGKISVIVPVHNGETTLQRCIESVLGQTWMDIELIVVNNASNDGTAAICAACTDPRLVYLEEPRRGVSRARNTGMAAASGDYITFVDADDFIEPEMFETMLAAGEYDAVYCGLFTENPDGSARKPMRLPGGGARNRGDILRMLLRAEALSVMFGPYCKLYHRDTTADLRFAENISVGEDLRFHFDALQRIHKAAFIDREFYHYVLYPQSEGHAKDSLKKIDMIPVWEYILEHTPPELRPLGIPTYIELLLNTMRFLIRHGKDDSAFSDLREKLRPFCGEILRGPYSWGRKRAALSYLFCPFGILRRFRRRKN